MKFNTYLRAMLLCTASVLATSLAARAQSATADGSVESVVVTGSRVISSIANSPTPLTVVTTDQLQTTTPSSVPDALNKLPVFQGSNTTRSNNNASQNDAGNVLNLRNFGSQRTLVLLDGHRVVPSNANGTVDTDVLPQMLMSRVDVVTGGASAVYGSDAVTGVVNFILDKNFTGVKLDANAGISSYGDGASYKGGVAVGTGLFSGRGHIEASFSHRHQDGIRSEARPEGQQVWSLSGTGTAANPYVNNEHATYANFSWGGKITCTGCAANNMQFSADGVIGPFYPGQSTGTNLINHGGDGAHSSLSYMTVDLTTDEAFSRFSYNISDSAVAYVQATAAQSLDRGAFQNNYIQTGNVPNTFFVNNPYLSAASQALLANPSGKFQLAKYINNQGTNGGFDTYANDRNLDLTAGVDGTLFGKYDWDMFYTHGESRLQLDDPHNQNNQKMYAAEDAVLTSTGQTACYVSTTIYAANFPGCVPMNPFGPTALTSEAYNYFTQDTHFTQTNILDNVGGSVSGTLFDDWAGPVKAAVSGEMRWLSYAVTSNALPTDKIDCTGLRLCNATTAFWQGNIAANQPAVSENVWEFAAESDLPLLADVPLAQAVNMNIAGRFTNYSASGAVQTWKIGLDWHVNDDVRFRATNSVDIRAPTLVDLFSAQQVTHVGYTDLHTGGTTSTTLIATQGNPDLVPEVARTYTAGIVLTPSFIPGLTTSLDYYTISLKNGISSISPTSLVTQSNCETSGGTSPFCAQYIRPLPFSDRTSANYPTQLISESLNAAYANLEGWDFEVDYGFDMSSVWDSAPGSVTLRLLANDQPVNQSLSYPGAPLTLSSIAKGHVTTFLGYMIDKWQFNFQNRWISGYARATQFGQVYAEPHVKSIDYLDMTVNRTIDTGGHSLDVYLSVQNIGNTRPPIIPTNAVNPGLYYEGIQGAGTIYDGVGRYFTVGVRTTF